MAVIKCATKEMVTKTRAPVGLATSWRVIERSAKVLDSSILNAEIVY